MEQSADRVSSIRQEFQVNLYNVVRGSYKKVNIQERVRPHWIISFVLDGGVETVSCGECDLAKPGDVMVHPPHIPFSEVTNSEGTHLWIACDVYISPNVDLLRLYPVPPVVAISDVPGYTNTFDELLKEWIDPSPFREITTSSLTLQMLGYILKSWQDSGSIQRPAKLLSPEDRFVLLINYMKEHMHETITRDKLSETLYLSPDYLDRVFHATYGLTPKQMLRDMRLMRAREWLEVSGNSIAWIAEACGLGDASYLNRLFVKHLGLTPGQYREKMQQAKENYIKSTEV